jgi:hypothetical protein
MPCVSPQNFIDPDVLLRHAEAVERIRIIPYTGWRSGNPVIDSAAKTVMVDGKQARPPHVWRSRRGMHWLFIKDDGTLHVSHITHAKLRKMRDDGTLPIERMLVTNRHYEVLPFGQWFEPVKPPRPATKDLTADMVFAALRKDDLTLRGLVDDLVQRYALPRKVCMNRIKRMLRKRPTNAPAYWPPLGDLK